MTTFTQANKILDNVSVAAGGNVVSEVPAGASRVRVLIDASGADVTVSLEASGDGTTWHELVAYAAGAVGAQAVLQTCATRLRVKAANAAAGAQSVTAWLVSQTD